MIRKRRVALRCLFACVLIAMFGGGFLLVRSWWFGRKVEAKLAALRAAGQPVSLMDLAAPAAQSDQDAAALLLGARWELAALAEEIKTNYQHERERNGGREPAESTFSSALQEDLAKTFAAHPKMLPLLERAADCQRFTPQRDYRQPLEKLVDAMLDFCQVQRSAAQTLQAWALLEASRGRLDEGLRTCGALFRLTKLFDQDPFLVTHFVSIAIRDVAIQTSGVILQSGPTSSAAREAWRKDAELNGLPQRLRAVLAAERAWGVTWIREQQPPAIRWTGLNAEANSFLEIMNTVWNDAAKAPDPTQTLDNGNRMAMSAGPLARDFLPAWGALLEAETRILAETRCLLVLLAAQDAPGLADKPALSIDDLALPDPLTIDPYTGGKLTLRKIPGGWLIYSIGRDRKDDGGKVGDEFIDVGFAPPAAPSMASPKTTIGQSQNGDSQ